MNRQALPFLAIFVGLLAFDLISAAVMSSGSDSVLGAAVIGAWVMQPLLIAAWTALAPGSLFMRLPVVVPLTAMLFVAPELIPAVGTSNQNFEFLMYVIAAIATFVLTLILLLIIRKATRFQIASARWPGPPADSRFHFDTKYMLAVITINSVLLAMISQLNFQTPRTTWPTLGPSFYIEILVMGAAICYVLSVPMLAVPLLVLAARVSAPAIPLAISFWVVATSAVVAVMVHLEGESANAEFFAAIALMQFGAFLLALVSSLALRVSGLRLVRGEAPTAASQSQGQ